MSNIERLYANVPRLWDAYIFNRGPQPFDKLRVAPSIVEGRGSAPHQGIRTRLVRARHGDSSGVRGAAWLWRLE